VSAGRWARAFYAAGEGGLVGPVTEGYDLRLDERHGADRNVLGVAIRARLRARVARGD
jgi:hypothetical protein